MTTHFEAEVWQTAGRWHVELLEIENAECGDDMVSFWRMDHGSWFGARADALGWARRKRDEIVQGRAATTPPERVRL